MYWADSANVMTVFGCRGGRRAGLLLVMLSSVCCEIITSIGIGGLLCQIYILCVSDDWSFPACVSNAD